MELLPITREHLVRMQGILESSAGHPINITDEIGYFDRSTISGWWVAMRSDGHPLGFIRHFRQNFDWSLGELHVSPDAENRLTTAKALLKKFQNSVQFSTSHRLRFDVNRNDEDLNNVLKSEGFSEKTQVFRFFECNNLLNSTLPAADFASVSDSESVAETLSHLHPVSAVQAKEWVEKRRIVVVRNQGNVVSAAQIYEFNNALEVNRFATHEKYLRRGFAKKLMESIFQEAVLRKKNRVYLKVEENRTSAVAFYQSVGFIEHPEKCQVWHSRWY